ncbi:MAG: excinuclease ABC subunit UvrA [Candidatus Pacebacteria bacterium]|nr:excinuclease ABC subunit UvrA [Candidatus Paceibacterota bacterium]
MAKDFIKIRGARVHNLKSIDLDIPKNKLVVFTGVSGSGKSSLAFDTLYAEGQRRYVESLSTYARQFLGVMQKPDVDKIEGISPAISIDQRKASHNPRSTVGTMTEIYDYLRVLFARIGTPYCPKCHREVKRQTIDQIVEQILSPVRNFSGQGSGEKLKNGKISNGVKLPKESEVYILGPVVKSKKGEHKAILQEAQKAGFVRARIDGIIQRLDEAVEKELDRQKKHSIEIVVDRLVLDKELEKSRLVDSLEIALRLGKGAVVISPKLGEEDLIFSEHFACDYCEISLPEIEPRLFSFNSPFGACAACQGLGKKLEVSPDLVIPNKNLSISEGAIFPWARASHKIGRQGYYWNILQDLANEYRFSLDKPVKELSFDAIKLILYGENRAHDNVLSFPTGEQASYGAGRFQVSGYEGVIPNLERRYWETESDWAKEEIKKYMVARLCEKCQGRRLKPEALTVKIAGKSIADVCEMSGGACKEFFEKLIKGLSETDSKISQPLIKEIISRLGFLIEVGLEYLTLSREAETLSGGEEQRTRLATQIGSKLTGVLYILDEPSVGLHPRDQSKLIKTLKELRDTGNTVIVVEHDILTVKEADWIIDIGPGAGKHGGKVIFEGTPKQLLNSKTLTGEYLSGKKKIGGDIKRIAASKKIIKPQNLIIKGAKENNLKNIDVKIPLGKLVCVTGIYGSGKSSLVNDILAKALYKKFYRSKEIVGKHETILGTEFLDKVVLVDQSPIGRTPRSNPATYTAAFNYIREIFAKTKEARIRGYRSGRFSFNVKGGRCEECEGQGVKKIEMYFLPDVYVQCQECFGKRYSRETLEIEYKGKNISDVLNMTVEEALEFFKNIPALRGKLQTLNDVGISYVELGQPAPSLSGGEAQRIKLATELSKKSTGKTFYILDEPTTGLHPDDINKLLFVLRALVDKGNTVLVVEHNIDFIKTADWIIDLGPESGDKGGEIVAEGGPLQISQNKNSWTGRFLKSH